MSSAVAQSIMIVSKAGVGKSTLIPTLPWYRDGKWDGQTPYILSFRLDPQGESAYAWGGKRVKTIIVDSDVAKVPEIRSKDEAKLSSRASMGYNKYDKMQKFVNSQSDSFWQQFQWGCVDSFTWLVDSMLFEIADKEKRLGDKFTLEDYGRVASTIKLFINNFLNLGIPVVFTAHSYDKALSRDKDGEPVDTILELATYGQMKTYIPGMFANIFDLRIRQQGSNSKRVLRVKRTGEDLYTRTILTGLRKNEYDVTVNIDNPPEAQGLSDLFLNYAPTSLDGMDIETI